MDETWFCLKRNENVAIIYVARNDSADYKSRLDRLAIGMSAETVVINSTDHKYFWRAKDFSTDNFGRILLFLKTGE